MLEILTNPRIIERIEAERESSKLKPFIDLLLQRFEGFHVQELGGTVRNAVMSEWQGGDFTSEDFDLIVDDSQQDVDLFEICDGLPGNVGKNYFGNVKWKVEGYVFDVTKYSTQKGAKSLEGFFTGGDFNIGTIAYCPEHGRILSLNALDGIRNRKLVLMNACEGRPQATLVRAVNFERRLDFEFDDQTLRYLRRTYTPEMNPSILEYVRYKGMPQSVYHHVVRRLTEICSVPE